MKRRDLVTIALQGDFGKPRPALVIQADAFDALATVTVLPVTGTRVNAPLLRITIEPDAQWAVEAVAGDGRQGGDDPARQGRPRLRHGERRAHAGSWPGLGGVPRDSLTAAS